MASTRLAAEGFGLQRQQRSSLESTTDECSEVSNRHPDQSRELGVIEFLAQQLSPPACRGQVGAALLMEQFALDAEDEVELDAGESNEMAGIKRGWSQEDEALLMRLVSHHGSHKGKWKLIASSMPDTRTPGQVREKWLRLQREAEDSSQQCPRSSSQSLISVLQHAALQQQAFGDMHSGEGTPTVVAGSPDRLTPQCHRCHHRKLGRGWASCERGLAHHFCDRCVHNSFQTDFSELVANPRLWCCPVCNLKCPCAACERRAQQQKNNPHGSCHYRTAASSSSPRVRSVAPSPALGPKIKKGWSDSDAALLVTLVHEHREHKNKWKLVAAAMPDARTPGQVKEKYHRMQKLPEFEQMISRLGKSQPGSPTIAATAATGSPQKRARDAPVQPPPCMITPSEATSPTELALMTSHKSASGFRGVSRAGSRWEAYIGNGTSGKRYIGRFDTAREAAIAYAAAYSNQPKATGNLSQNNATPKQSPKLTPKPSPSIKPVNHKRQLIEQSEGPLSEEVAAGLVRSSKAASGYMGVSRAGCRWEAYVSAGQRGKRFKRYIGCYDTPELAAKAYLDASSKSELMEDDQEFMSDQEEDSEEWFSDECEASRKQVIHALSSLPSLATVAQDCPPTLNLPPASIVHQPMNEATSAQVASEALLAVSRSPKLEPMATPLYGAT